MISDGSALLGTVTAGNGNIPSITSAFSRVNGGADRSRTGA